MSRIMRYFPKLLVLFVAFTLIICYNEIVKAREIVEQESNNSFSTANAINCGDFVKGLIYQTTNPSQDKDYFKVYLKSGDIVSISLINAHEAVNYNLYLYNSSQSLVASSTNSTGKNEFIQYTVPSNGYYYVLVSSAYGHSGSHYYYLQLMRSSINTANANSGYDRAAAVNYAKSNYSYKDKYTCRGITFANFANDGGDCTNFASQVLFAGYMNMIYSSASGIESNTNYWFYRTPTNRSTTWTGANYFRQHWGNFDGSGYNRAYQVRIYPVWYAIERFSSVVLGFLKEGDIVQHVRYDNCEAYHSQVIVSKTSTDLLYAQHSVLPEYFEYGRSFIEYLQKKTTPKNWVILYRVSSK
ncbi:amidase domain-containing protein [Caldicellulosiruptor morganii]|uniref:Amidase domain-containing protein n=1 Tax=Caldicellulosiruptor morganii TaxID=1387555 RepID=A0ABY7BNV2_9FIRM|nr:amidase domain-containing protein [Caldicellulosiruptor morganii]WAM33216.1 amidase domain-containing protein [Caldicellulosiruptor morganii]